MSVLHSTPTRSLAYESAVGEPYLDYVFEQAQLGSGPSASIEARWEDLQCELERALESALLTNSTLGPRWRASALGRGLAVLAAALSTVPSIVPEIDVDLDSDVRFEWIGAPMHRVLMTVSANNVLHYAAVWPGGAVNGSEVFVGEIPDAVWRALGRLARSLRLDRSASC